MQIIAATHNKGKLREIREILKEHTIVSLSELHISCEVEEDGQTFLHNAQKKAREIQTITGGAVLADDSGLEVEALHGAPGVYSARYAGENATDSENVQKLLSAMKDQQNKKARFVCTMVLIKENGEELTAQGECHGEITDTPQGENGFGYDPIFYIPEKQKTMAMLSSKEKNAISHRRRALDQLASML